MKLMRMIIIPEKIVQYHRAVASFMINSYSKFRSKKNIHWKKYVNDYCDNDNKFRLSSVEMQQVNFVSVGVYAFDYDNHYSYNEAQDK